MLGAGTAPAGTSPAGIGLPISLSTLRYSASTTGAVSSVQIDPWARDIVMDGYGNEAGMSDAAQRVELCITTALESILAQPSFGLGRPTKITDNIVSVVQGYIDSALAPVVSDGSIKVLEVTVTPVGARVTVVIRWMDLRSTSNEVLSTTRTF